jgi:hypothetical protein
MSSAKLDFSSNPVMTFWLSRELEKEIPDLDLYGSERKLLDFASRDLETCLRANWKNINHDKVENALNSEDQAEIKEFLKVWTKQWLEKWRERVTFCQKTPRFSLAHAKAKKKALKLFKQMKRGQELKEMVVQKLINSGEVCMAELIAENLIIEEIAQRLKMDAGKTSADKVALEPWHIFQEVLPRVKSLTEKKTPIIHLKLMIDS